MHGLIQNPDVLLFVMKGNPTEQNRKHPSGAAHLSEGLYYLHFQLLYMFLIFNSAISHQK